MTVASRPTPAAIRCSYWRSCGEAVNDDGVTRSCHNGWTLCPPKSPSRQRIRGTHSALLAIASSLALLGDSPDHRDLVGAPRLVSVRPGLSARCTRASVFLPPPVVYGRPITSHWPVSSLNLSPTSWGTREWCRVARAAASHG